MVFERRYILDNPVWSQKLETSEELFSPNYAVDASPPVLDQFVTLPKSL